MSHWASGESRGPVFIARVRGSESFSSHPPFPAWDNVGDFVLLRGARGRAAGRQTKRQEREDGQGARPTCSWVARLAALTVLVAAPRLCATGSRHPEGTRSRSCAPTWERWHWAWCCPRGSGTKLLAGARGPAQLRAAPRQPPAAPQARAPAAGISELCKADRTGSEMGQTWSVDVSL